MKALNSYATSGTTTHLVTESHSRRPE